MLECAGAEGRKCLQGTQAVNVITWHAGIQNAGMLATPAHTHTQSAGNLLPMPPPGEPEPQPPSSQLTGSRCMPPLGTSGRQSCSARYRVSRKPSPCKATAGHNPGAD